MGRCHIAQAIRSTRSVGKKTSSPWTKSKSICSTRRDSLNKVGYPNCFNSMYACWIIQAARHGYRRMNAGLARSTVMCEQRREYCCNSDSGGRVRSGLNSFSPDVSLTCCQCFGVLSPYLSNKMRPSSYTPDLRSVWI